MSRPKSTAGTKAVARPTALSKPAVVDAVRQAILANNLVPGQRLVEAELCDLLGASRGTVRSALMDLVHEGLVERIANKGARVRIVGIQEALQIAEVRMVVESLCVARAAERVTNEQIKELRNIAKGLKDRARQSDATGFADLTHRLFEIYVHAADQPVAAEILSRLRARNTRHGFRLTFRPGRAQVALPYWLDLIDAICNRDPDAARRALERHAKNVHDAMEALAHDHAPFEVHRDASRPGSSP
jgi:DNA-binding GntR family transcriptional regulator